MSVCVKGMYLPPSCYFCPMTNESFYLCKANNPYKQLEDDCEERRPNWCPLIEVHEPHGRLGDLDAVAKQIDYVANIDWNKSVGASGGMLAALEIVEDAQTIIPADESDMDSFIRVFEEDDEEDGMDSFIRILKE